LDTVFKQNLCNRCGTCVGLSNGRIVFTDKAGRYLPKIIDDLDQEESARLFKVCSGKGFNFPEYRKVIYGDEGQFHPFIGNYRNIYVGYSNDPEIRYKSASGGILSAILIWLLDNRMIDGAVVLKMSDQEPWLTQPTIATTRNEILEAAQSKYIISSVNEILPEISSFKGNLAYVGIPGQVQSIRMLQRMKDPSVARIKYIFGPFYGNTLHFTSIKSFLRSYGIHDYHEVKKLYFRHGEWPGKMRIELKSGRVIELPKFHANYLIPFHILKNSLLCTDLSNEFTDLSGGDAWAPNYEERGLGFSMIIPRSEQGQKILMDMHKDRVISLEEINEKQAIIMHSHGYDLKKNGTFIRLRLRKFFGLPVPDYGYELKGFKFKRYLMEIVIDSLFIILGTRPARYLAEQIPPGFIGRLFEKARTLWKKSTYRIKRDNVNR